MIRLSDEELKKTWLEAEQSMGFLFLCLTTDMISKENYADNECIHGEFTAKALLKRVAEEFEKSQCYKVVDGKHIWNPQMFRQFWQSLLNECE